MSTTRREKERIRWTSFSGAKRKRKSFLVNTKVIPTSPPQPRLKHLQQRVEEKPERLKNTRR